MNIISSDQFAFLPHHFILGNILFTQETLDWVAHFGQPLFFFKLDFRKAFDRVDLDFFERAMSAMGFLSRFLSMTLLPFQDAKASMKVNGVQLLVFSIRRGVCQGFSLAPYLFLSALKVLNAMVKIRVSEGVIKEIELPIEECQ